MMEVAIALLVGFVAAGFVWYGWGLLENLLALLGFKEKKAAASLDESKAGRDDLEL